jgi:transcriptional regulator with XRE-family HTH domain
MAPTSPAEGLNAALAATLRAERGATSMTVDQLAAKSGIPKRTLLRLLQAERHINTDHLYALAVAFELEPADLIQMAQRRLARLAKIDADQDAADELARKRAERNQSEVPDMVTDEELIGQPSVAAPEPKNDVEGDEDPEEV